MIGDLWRRRPALLAVGVAGVVLVLGMLQRLPCHLAGWPGDYDILMGDLCYSDIPLLYRARVFHTGDFPFHVDPGRYETLEYPVLTGLFADLVARLARWAHGVPPGVADDAVSVTFYEYNAVLLIGCGLVAVWASTRVAARRWHPLLVAAAPSLALTSLINWDLFAVMLAAVAVYAWSRSAPVWAGVWIGLGFAAKLYPVLLLGPLLVLCVRAGKLRAYAGCLGATVLTWAVVNLPVALVSPEGWAWFWEFNSGRGGEFGSIWYLFVISGDPVGGLNRLSLGLFLAACVGIALLAVRAPRRPRLAQLAFLVLAAFLMVNKVYSPQYVLWLLPFAVLARPSWRDWAVWQLAEVGYWAAVWMHIGGYFGDHAWLYPAATVLRLLATGYLAAIVVRDVLRPWYDLGADEDGEDPAGGVLVGALDALPRWLAGLGPPRNAGLAPPHTADVGPRTPGVGQLRTALTAARR
ncbi:MAG: glycosyltransferase family 87 protein [Micromonosporaceae bacterium]